MASKILVLGAGELGSPIITHMARHSLRGKAEITVLLRNKATGSPERQAQLDYLKSIGVESMFADVAAVTAEELVEIFTPFDTIVGATGMAAPPGTQLKIARAVQAGGVRRYVPWQFGLDYDAIGRGKAQDLFDEQLDVRDLLRRGGTEWVIVSTGIFMTFLFEDAFGVVVGLRDGGRSGVSVRGLGSWEDKVTYTHPEDIGRVTAEVVMNSQAWAEDKDGVIFVAGATASFEEVARAVESVLSQSRLSEVQVRRELWSREYLERDLEAHPTDGMAKYRCVLAGGIGVHWEKETSWNEKRGMAMMGLEECAARVLATQSF